MSGPMTEAWARLTREITSDSTVRAVVVTGAGSTFSSGGDTGWIGGDPDATVDQLRTKMMPFYRTWLGIRDVPVPVLAAINGPAVGAGACIALAADVRVGSERAKFTVPFLKLGLHPGMATTYLLPEVVGVAAARDLLFTGRVIDAQEMLRLGIISQVLPVDGFADAAIALGEQIAANAPIATRLTKAGLLRGGADSLDAAVDWEALAQPITMATADLQEGVAAAQQKRQPQFVGE
jgi:enoyl-CoA hydratase